VRLKAMWKQNRANEKLRRAASLNLKPRLAQIASYKKPLNPKSPRQSLVRKSVLYSLLRLAIIQAATSFKFTMQRPR